MATTAPPLADPVNFARAIRAPVLGSELLSSQLTPPPAIDQPRYRVTRAASNSHVTQTLTSLCDLILVILNIKPVAMSSQRRDLDA